jgi:hypothetical protein
MVFTLLKMVRSLLLGWLLIGTITKTYDAVEALSEDDRMKGYIDRNYTWPLPLEAYKPPTKGWKALMEHRFRQIEEIDDFQKRYEGYIQTLGSAIHAPNFTQYGWGLARAPDDLMEALRKGIRDGVAAGPRLEDVVEVIEGDQPVRFFGDVCFFCFRPFFVPQHLCTLFLGYSQWFIDRPDLTQRVLEELQHYPETWVGLELHPYKAYGFRLYRNNSQLHMHVDKTQTHIVSFILHIDSSDDAEPWPILIEDLQGSK